VVFPELQVALLAEVLVELGMTEIALAQFDAQLLVFGL
jgi:hypothetical protein